VESRPGNLYSTPRSVAIDPASTGLVEITLDKVIPPIPDPPATTFVRHERIQSERLTSSGAGRSSSARTSCCPRATTSTRKLAIPS